MSSSPAALDFPSLRALSSLRMSLSCEQSRREGDPQPAPSVLPTGAASQPRARHRVWVGACSKLGVAAFVFFLVKGLLWLAVPAAIAAFAMR